MFNLNNMSNRTVKGKKPAQPEKPAKEEPEDVESDDGKSAKEQIPAGLKWQANSSDKAFDVGEFYAVNRYSKLQGKRVGHSMVKSLMANYSALMNDVNLLAATKQKLTLDQLVNRGLSKDTENYILDGRATISQLIGSSGDKARRALVYDRNYVYLYEKYNLCGPFEDVVFVLEHSGMTNEEAVAEVESNAFNIGNIGDRTAADWYADMLGVDAFSDGELEQWKETAEALQDEYRERYEANKAEKARRAEENHNYDLEDIIKFAFEIKKRDTTAAKSGAKSVSPSGRIGRRVPILTKMAKLGDKVLKIQDFAQKKPSNPTNRPQNPAQSKFILLETDHGTIMVEKREDLQALIKLIHEESPAADFPVSTGKQWLAEFDRLKKEKNTPMLGRGASSAVKKGGAVATKPGVKPGKQPAVKPSPGKQPAKPKPKPKPEPEPEPEPSPAKQRKTAPGRIVPPKVESVASESQSASPRKSAASKSSSKQQASPSRSSASSKSKFSTGASASSVRTVATEEDTDEY